MPRRLLMLVVVMLVGVMPVRPAGAGGFAVVELTRPIPVAVAGEPITIAFRVLGHGQPDARQAGLHPVITLLHRESRERTTATALAATDDPSRYEASFTLNATGSYKWNIAAEPYPATAMPTLTVVATAADARAAEAVVETERDADAVTIVTIGEGSFSPARLTIAPGATVEWTNASVLPHQVVWTGVDHDDSAILRQGESIRVTFKDEGTFTYYCGPHPYMTGEIVVAKDAVAD
jgi:plastocyanin